MSHNASKAVDGSESFLAGNAAANSMLIVSTLLFGIITLGWLMSTCARSRRSVVVSSHLDNVADDLDDEMPLDSGYDFIEEELEFCGVGRFQYKVLVATWLGWMADGAEGELLGYLVPLLMKEDWGLHEDDVSYLSSLSSGAMALSAMASGRIADSYGRRPVFTMSCLIIAVGSIASAMAPGWMSMAVARVFGNFGVGALLCVDVPLMSEFMPKSRRNSFLSILHFGFSAGMLWVRLAALICFGSGANIHWRIFVLICAVPVVLAFLSRRHLPETPHALLKMGREQEARVVLATIAKANGVSRFNKEDEAEEIGKDSRSCDDIELSDISISHARKPATDGDLEGKPENENEEMHCPSPTASDVKQESLRNESLDQDTRTSISRRTVSSKGYWLRMFCISLLTFAMQAGCAMTLWISHIAESLGVLNGEFYATMSVGAVLIQCVHIFSYFLFSTAVSPWDVLFFGNGCCFVVLACMAKVLQGQPIQMIIAAVCLVLWNIPFSLAWGALYCAIVSDAPPQQRATAVGCADAASRLSAVLHPILSERMLVLYGPMLACSTFAQGWLLATFLTFYLRVSATKSR